MPSPGFSNHSDRNFPYLALGIEKYSAIVKNLTFFCKTQETSVESRVLCFGCLTYLDTNKLFHVVLQLFCMFCFFIIIIIIILIIFTKSYVHLQQQKKHFVVLIGIYP